MHIFRDVLTHNLCYLLGLGLGYYIGYRQLKKLFALPLRVAIPRIVAEQYAVECVSVNGRDIKAPVMTEAEGMMIYDHTSAPNNAVFVSLKNDIEDHRFIIALGGGTYRLVQGDENKVLMCWTANIRDI